MGLPIWSILGISHVYQSAIAQAMKTNQSLIKLGYVLNDPTCRNNIDRQIMRNNDTKRKKRQEEKKRKMEEARNAE